MERGFSVFVNRSRREVIRETLQSLSGGSCRCPSHSPGPISPLSQERLVSSDTGPLSTDYAYEVSACSVRVGRGVTREVGKDFANRGVRRVLLLTDKSLLQLLSVSTARDSLEAEGVACDVFSEVRVEPTDKSFREAIHRAQRGQYDGFLAVGGGSVMDTAKAARLFDTYPEKEFLDFVNQPIGKGEPILRPLKPLICIPTTSGTGSETTGVAIFDLKSMNAKTGFSNRALCPTLAIVDPLNTLSMPRNVTIYSGLDVLCHALESYTAIPYYQRSPMPTDPKLRPSYQGRNPVSDIWAVEAIKLINKYFFRAVDSIEDEEAYSQMSFASLLGGIGFGNAGVHLCHAISYGISGMVRDFYPDGYSHSHPIIPHGLSVIMTAPAVFSQVGYVWPDRCIQLAGLLGAKTSNVRVEDAGRCLSDQLCKYIQHLGIPNGLSALGFSTEDIPSLVEKTIPQERLTKLSPNPATAEFIESILLNSMTIYD